MFSLIIRSDIFKQWILVDIQLQAVI